MRTLRRRFDGKHFRRLSTLGWVKLIVFFPILMMLFVANELVNFTAFMISALVEYGKHSVYEARVFESRCYNTISDEVPYHIEAYREHRD